MTISEHIATLRSMSESIDSSKPARIPETMEAGDMFPQGDIGLLMVEKLPSKKTLVKWESGNYQLAPGTSKGSRHTIPERFRNVIRIYRLDINDPLCDLGIVADAKFDLEHPEHADHLDYPAGEYVVRHEQNEQRERILD